MKRIYHDRFYWQSSGHLGAWLIVAMLDTASRHVFFALELPAPR
jgi:hypothetical protein